MAEKWFVKWEFLRDVYFLMVNDLRFSSPRSLNGVRYSKVSRHLFDCYGIEIKVTQLKYLVSLIRKRKR